MGIGTDADLRNVKKSNVAEQETDIIKLYMKEISRYRLLSAEEEVELASRAQQGDEDAKTMLIESNLRLVIKVAKKYIGHGVAFPDLVQDGNIGLMKAVDRFDPTMGYKFSTYATWWIRQTISRGIADNGRTIRVPVHMTDLLAKIKRVRSGLVIELGREPSDEELAVALDMPLEKVLDALSVQTEPVYMDTPVGDDEDSSVGDFIPDEKAGSPEDVLMKKMLRSDLEYALARLNEREQKVIRLRFGFDGESPKTLEQIGAILGITRERVRQIENRGLRQLRIYGNRAWM